MLRWIGVRSHAVSGATNVCAPVAHWVRIPKPVAIISPACSKRICWRLPARALAAGPLTSVLKEKGTFSVAGVATDLAIMNDQPDIIIGERHGWGEAQSFGISTLDQRQHVYIIGKTGSGKTTLLRNLMAQHIS